MEQGDTTSLKERIRLAFADLNALPEAICPCDCFECIGITEAYKGRSRDELTDDDLMYFFARGPTSLLSHEALRYFLPTTLIRAVDPGWEELIEPVIWNLRALKGRDEVRFTAVQHEAVWDFLSFIIQNRRGQVDESSLAKACEQWNLPRVMHWTTPRIKPA